MRKVSKLYGEGETEVHALSDIDFDVDRGTLVAVMGPSGSGKSTLLTIAGGLEDPTSGDVLVEGHSLREMSRNERARLRRRNIGFVFQDYNLLPGLSALENVSLPLELDGVALKDSRALAHEALELLGLTERADHFPDAISGGERQRVAIARSIVGHRSLVLADEPSGALDSENGEAVVRLIKESCQRGLAAILVTHDAKLASWADRIVFLHDGRVVDRTAEIPTPEAFVESAVEP
jgi:putative ABC transport system ATP-binding protein